MMSSDSSATQKFFELALEAARIDSEILDEPVEPYFDAVLSFVVAHPTSRDDLVDAVMQLAHDPNLGPPELIQYCMHALRWDDFKQQISDWLLVEKSERVRHVLRKLLMSFDDGWYDADMYVRFGGNPP